MRWTEDKLNRVAEMLRTGASSSQIGSEFGVTKDAVISIVRRNEELNQIGFVNPGPFSKRPKGKVILKPSVEQRRKEQKEMAEARKAAGLRYFGPRTSIEDIESRLAEIPQDTRSLTGRVLGDPLPGRSALDQRAVQ